MRHRECDVKSIRLLLVAALFALTWFSVAPSPADARCRTADRTINRRIRFEARRTSSVIKDTIRLCTAHDYRLRALAGQTMSVNLVTGRRTTMSLLTPSGERLLDGGREWSGELPEDGEYVISIGTDATARYALEVMIR